MHNWHIPLLLILTVLEPIFSEHSSIDGGRCCIHSLRSPHTEERLSSNGPYRFGKSSLENSGLNDGSETFHTNYANELREVTPQSINFIDGRHLQLRTLTPYGRSIDDRKQYRSVTERNLKDRLTVRHQYYKSAILQNGYKTDTTPTNRLTSKGGKREYKEHSGFNLYSYLVSRSWQNRKGRIQNVRQEVIQNTRSSEVFGLNDIISRRFRNHRSLDRQNDRNLIRQTFRNVERKLKSTVPNGEKDNSNEIDTDLFKRNLRKRDLTRISNNAKNRGADGSIIFGQSKTNAYIRNEDNAIRQIKNRHIIHSKNSQFKSLNHNTQQRENMASTTIRNTYESLINELSDTANIGRPASENIHERVISSTRNTMHLVRTGQSDARRVLNQEFTRNPENQRRTKDWHIDMRNYERHTTANIYDKISSLDGDVNKRITNRQMARSREEQNTIVRDRNVIRTYDEDSRDKSRYRKSSLERAISQENTRHIREMQIARNREERNTNTVIRNSKRFLKYNTRHSMSALEHGIRQETTKIIDRQMSPNSEERNNPAEIKNHERYSMDNSRPTTSSLESTLNNENTRKITKRQIARSLEERNINIRYKPTYSRNHERYLGDEIRQETSSISKGHQRNTRNQRRDNDIYVQNYEWYSNDDNSDRTTSLERGMEKKSKGKISTRQMIRNRYERNTFLRVQPTGIRNSVKTSIDNTSNRISLLERVVSQKNTRTNTDRQVNLNRQERNQPIEIRNHKRDSRYYNREGTSSLVRAISQENIRKTVERDTAQNREERKTIVRAVTADNRNTDKYSRVNTPFRTSSLERVISQENIRKHTNRQIDQYHQERDEATEIKSDERNTRYNNREKRSPIAHFVSQENTRKTIERDPVQKREERKMNVRADITDNTNSDRYSRVNTRERASSLERCTSQENTRKNTDRQMNYNRQERNEPNEIRTRKRDSRYKNRERTSPLVRAMGQENIKKLAERETTQNREEQRTNVRAKTTDNRNSDWYLWDNTRDRSSTSERAIGQKTIDRHMDYIRQERNEPTEVRNVERYTRYNNREMTSISPIGHSVSQENIRKIIVRDMAQNREERKINVRVETINSRNSDRYSTVSTRVKTLSLQRGISQKNTRKITERQMALNHEDRNTNIRDKPCCIRNSDRYSRDNTRDRTLSLERALSQENIRKNTDRQMEHNREQRNEPTELRNDERNSRYNNRERTSLVRAIRQKSTRKITVSDMARNRKERNTNVRDEYTDVRNSQRYLRDNTRDRTSSLERAISQENIRKNTDRQMDHKRQERNEPTDIRNRDSRYNNLERKRSSSLLRAKNQENIRKITERETAQNREERKTNIRAQITNNRDSDRYSRDKTGDRISRLKRGVSQANTRKIDEKEMARNDLEQNANIKDKLADIRTYNKYSRDNTRERTSSLERAIKRENIRKNTDRQMDHNRQERNVPIQIRNDERYSRYNNRESTSSLERAITEKNPRKILESYMVRNRDERYTNVRDESTNIRNSVRYLRDNVKNQPSQKNTRKITDRQIGRNREVRYPNVRNEPTDFRNELTSTTVKKPLKLFIKEDSINKSSVFYWQYLLYVLQGIYVVGIYMHENTKIGSMHWLTSSRLLKVD